MPKSTSIPKNWRWLRAQWIAKHRNRRAVGVCPIELPPPRGSEGPKPGGLSLSKVGKSRGTVDVSPIFLLISCWFHPDFNPVNLIFSPWNFMFNLMFKKLHINIISTSPSKLNSPWVFPTTFPCPVLRNSLQEARTRCIELRRLRLCWLRRLGFVMISWYPYAPCMVYLPTFGWFLG